MKLRATCAKTEVYHLRTLKNILQNSEGFKTDFKSQNDLLALYILFLNGLQLLTITLSD